MGQTILITGANRGIGLALTSELLEMGHRVLATARQPAGATGLKTLWERHPEALVIREMDVISEASIIEAIAGAPPLDVLVNNAAVFPEEGDESIFAMNLEHFREAFETNVLGVVRVTRILFPLLQQGANPRIINISSGAGSVADKEDHFYYAYSASKAALNMVTRALAAELRGICVVAMTPGWVRTEMGGPNAPLAPDESARAIAKTITSLTMEKTSHFIDRNGADVSYGW